MIPGHLELPEHLLTRHTMYEFSRKSSIKTYIYHKHWPLTRHLDGQPTTGAITCPRPILMAVESYRVLYSASGDLSNDSLISLIVQWCFRSWPTPRIRTRTDPKFRFIRLTLNKAIIFKRRRAHARLSTFMVRVYEEKEMS